MTLNAQSASQRIPNQSDVRHRTIVVVAGRPGVRGHSCPFSHNTTVVTTDPADRGATAGLSLDAVTADGRAR